MAFRGGGIDSLSVHGVPSASQNEFRKQWFQNTEMYLIGYDPNLLVKLHDYHLVNRMLHGFRTTPRDLCRFGIVVGGFPLAKLPRNLPPVSPAILLYLGPYHHVHWVDCVVLHTGHLVPRLSSCTRQTECRIHPTRLQFQNRRQKLIYIKPLEHV
jgi:hypothetical protein